MGFAFGCRAGVCGGCGGGCCRGGESWGADGLGLVAEEVAQTGELEGAGDGVGSVGLADGGVVGFGLVVLVGYVAYDGFEEVLDGDEAGYAAVLVDDDAHVLLFALHLAEELGYVFGLGDEGYGALDAAYGAMEGLGVGDVEEVVGEGDTGDVVERGGVDGDAGEGVLLDDLGELLQGEGAGDGYDLGARGHDLADYLVAELDDGTDQLAVGLFEDAFFFSGFEECVHGLGGMLFFGDVLGLGEGDDGDKELEEEGDGKDEVEENLKQEADADDPEPTGAGEEKLRDDAAEDEQEKDNLADGDDGFGPDASVGEDKHCEETQAEEGSDGGEGELAEERCGERGGLAGEAETGLYGLLPGVDVVLILAGEELAHLGVDTVDVGDQHQDEEEEGED